MNIYLEVDMLKEQSQAVFGKSMPSSLHRTLALITAQNAHKAVAEKPVLPIGLPVIDRDLPEAGLAAGRLHEIAGSAAVGFLIRLLGKLSGPVLWCVSGTESRRLYGPGLVRAGFDPARLTIAAGKASNDILWAAEEGLKSQALSAVVLEAGSALSLTASRRLHLAAEAGECFGFVLSQMNAKQAVVPPSAASTRWHIDPLPRMPATQAEETVCTWSVRLQRCRGATISAASSAMAGSGDSFGEWHVDVGKRGFLGATEGLAENAPNPLFVAA